MAGFILPVGGDRADGVTNLPAQPLGASGSGKVGTPIPTGKLQVNSNSPLGQTVEEEPDSPEFERAEQATFQHRLRMSFSTALSMLSNLPRGTFVKDSFGNIWRILSSKIQSRRGTDASLSYTAESISFDSPPDEFSCQAVDLGLDILKHPRYAWAILPNSAGNYYSVPNPVYQDSSGTQTPGPAFNVPISDIQNAIVRMVQNYEDSPVYPSNYAAVNGYVHDNILIQLNNGSISLPVSNPKFNPKGTVVSAPAFWNVNWSSSATNIIPSTNCQYFIVNCPFPQNTTTDPIAIAIAAAKEIISKIWRGEQTPYLTGYQITWSQYYFAPVFLNPGGYIDNPVSIVPDYFISPNQDGSNTIFDLMAQANPQAYSNNGYPSGAVNISWLRKADTVEFQRTWFKVTRTWVGSPIGNWDPQLYNASNRPQNANDFTTFQTTS